MKWMVASDIHGSAYYCERLMERMEKEQADKLLLLGDLLYHGPRNPLPKEYDTTRVYNMLNAKKDKILCVRGNCDAEVDQLVLSFPMRTDSLELTIEGRDVFVTHGHLYNMELLPNLKAGDVLLHGHTHIPAWDLFGDQCLYLNPGSVSIPKKDSPHSYLVIEKEACLFKTLDGDIYHTEKWI